MYNVHCYPIFRVCVKGLVGDDPAKVAEAAEMAVAEALNAAAGNSLVEVTGQGFCAIEFADGFDASLVDVMDGSRVMRSFTQSELHDQALEHAATLDDLIDAENDSLALMLGPIKTFLETVR